MLVCGSGKATYRTFNVTLRERESRIKYSTQKDFFPSPIQAESGKGPILLIDFPENRPPSVHEHVYPYSIVWWRSIHDLPGASEPKSRAEIVVIASQGEEEEYRHLRHAPSMSDTE